MSYNAWKTVHVLGVVLFLGSIILTTVWKMLADRTKNPPAVAYAQRLVAVTDPHPMRARRHTQVVVGDRHSFIR